MNTRRHFLQSSTALIALPFLESLGFRRFASAAPVATPPKRLIFLGFGWGITEATWYPDITKPGPDYELPLGLKPLERHRKDFSVVQGLWNKYSNEGHWGSTMWLTGANRYAQPGQSFHNSISADQVAAAQLGLQTRFASLQWNGTEKGDGGHGPGLSLAWDISGKPLGGQTGPVEAFHRLFAKDTMPLAQQKALLTKKRSVLDAVLDNAKSLQRGLARQDNAKLDEYFQGIRDIETRLSKEEQWLEIPRPNAPIPPPEATVVGSGFEEIRLMYDLMIAAMQTDSTRVLTFRQPVASLLISLGIKIHPHDMSHYHSVGGEKLDASQRRDTAQSELLAGFLDKLKSTREADGSSLFDHVALAYGSNLRTGHELTNCPTLLTGRGAGLKLGHSIVAPKDTPLCNAWLTMLHGIGVEAERHGDSTGVLQEILA
ncbi:MAG: hypothetical protein RLZZ244_1726 [Verrucomicrobiota bacterium]